MLKGSVLQMPSETHNHWQPGEKTCLPFNAESKNERESPTHKIGF